MATNEKYLNYYIETLISTLNDCVVRNVSMQANARISSELIEELQQKNEEIQNVLNLTKDNSSTLNSQYTEEIKKLTAEITELRAIRNQYENIKSEAAHVETFRNELVKERETHQATRNDLQTKVNNITNDFNNRINKLNETNNDKLNKVALKHKEEIKLLNDKIAYLEMSPAKRKKFDMTNAKPETVEEETNKDGGVF